MTRRLVLSYLAITVIVLAVLEIPLAIFFGQREEERLIADAERDAVVLASFYEEVLEDRLEPDPTAAEDYASRNASRVIVVDDSGISVLDTGAEVPRDFSTRPEVETALTGTRAAGIRYSETLETDIVFVAVPVASGGTVHGVLRLTLDAHEVTERIQNFWMGLVGVAVVVLVAVAGIGWAIARSVTRPLRDLEQASRRFARGDLDATEIDPDAPPEVRSLGSSMNTMAARLDDLIAEQRAFVGDASHQLRTPLTALRLRLENLETTVSTAGHEQEVRAAIDEIERLSELVNDLLRLARAEQKPPLETLDAAMIARDRVDTWQAVADESGVTIEAGIAPEVVEVEAAGGAIEQILDNALDNAVEHAPTGSTVNVGLEVDGSTVTIHVDDEGPGLDDEAKRRAVERFWRADPTKPGTGLGLAIADTLATASGGSLHLADHPYGDNGRGLSVVVRLRRAPVPTHRPA